MNRKNISFELKERVRKYLEFICKRQTNDRKENEIIHKLNKALKKEVMLEAYGKILMKTPKFRDNFSVDTLENIVFLMRPLTFSPEEFIYKVLSILMIEICSKTLEKLEKFLKNMRLNNQISLLNIEICLRKMMLMKVLSLSSKMAAWMKYLFNAKNKRTIKF